MHKENKNNKFIQLYFFFFLDQCIYYLIEKVDDVIGNVQMETVFFYFL